MVCVPIRCGGGNRSDLQGIAQSLLNQRGNAVTQEVGSARWIENQAWARAIYGDWCVNQKMANQLNPNTLTDFLSRWETIMGISPLPTDTLQVRRARIAAKFMILGKMPTTQAVTDLLTTYLGPVFLDLINTTIADGYAAFYNGAPITGGLQNVSNDNTPLVLGYFDPGWYSTLQKIYVEVKNQPYLTNNTFYQTVNQIFPLLGSYLPAYTTVTWFWNGFNNSGADSSTPGVATITVSAGSTTVTGTGTQWNTPSASGRYHVKAGSIIEAYANSVIINGLSVPGSWQRMKVAYVNSDTSLTLTEPASATITNGKYVIQGFFCDCSPTHFPYPPVGCLNVDNAGIANV